MNFDPEAVRRRREQMLLRLLFRATHAMNAEMARRVRAGGYHEFQPAFTAVLAHIDTEGTPVSTLARRIGVSRQAVSQVLQSIEAAGLVERQPNPNDARSVIVLHTARGRAILTHALDAMSSIEAECARTVGTDTIADLKRHLADLLARIDPDGTLASTGATGQQREPSPAPPADQDMRAGPRRRR